MTTTATDVLVAAYRTLAADEQDEVFERLRELRVQQAAGEESEAARFVRSLQTVASYIGYPDTVALTIDVYKQARAHRRGREHRDVLAPVPPLRQLAARPGGAEAVCDEHFAAHRSALSLPPPLEGLAFPRADAP